MLKNGLKVEPFSPMNLLLLFFVILFRYPEKEKKIRMESKIKKDTASTLATPSKPKSNTIPTSWRRPTNVTTNVLF